MKKCKNCIYFKETIKEKGKCQVLEMLETLECCIENENDDCKILKAFDHVYVVSLQELLLYSDNFKDYNIEFNYYWDYTDKINSLKKQGYSDEEIAEEFEYELIGNKELDGEYSFDGSNDDFLKHLDEYGLLDSCIDGFVFKVDSLNKKLMIDVIRYDN